VSTPDSSAADDSVADDSIEGDGQADAGDAQYAMELPEGFTVVSESPYMAMAQDGSNIAVVVLDATGQLEAVSDEDWQSQVVSGVEATGGTMTIDTFERTEISGYPALYMEATTTANDVEVQQSIVVVDNGSQTYSFNFTDVTGDWADAFAATIDSISFA